MTSAILDTNLLFSAPVRDLFLSIADLGVFKPKWSKKILEELTNSITSKRRDIDVKNIEYLISQMNMAFPDALISKYQNLINKVNLPDKDDQHILAAAIHAHTDWIVTFNLKDFPVDYIRKFNISVIHPDDFIMMLLDQNEKQVMIGLMNQAKNLQNPPMTAFEVLDKLKQCGLREASSRLTSLLS